VCQIYCFKYGLENLVYQHTLSYVNNCNLFYVKYWPENNLNVGRITLPHTQYKDLITYLLTPWSTVLLAKLTGFQLVKKFPAFCETRRFTTAFTSARHPSLSWASSIQSMPPHPTSLRSILILFSHLRLGLPSGLFLSGFPTKNLYTPPLSTIRATCPTHLILLDLITRKISGEQCRS